MNPLFSYTVTSEVIGTENDYRFAYCAVVKDAHTGEEHFRTAKASHRSIVEQQAGAWVNAAYAKMPATFRIVRRVVTTTNQGFGDNHRIDYVADAAGDWIEKDYGNGCKSYRMAVDCNARAVGKLREAA